jgi:hypothetical protein
MKPLSKFKAAEIEIGWMVSKIREYCTENKMAMVLCIETNDPCPENAQVMGAWSLTHGTASEMIEIREIIRNFQERINNECNRKASS